jgi:hypothetical protein
MNFGETKSLTWCFLLFSTPFQEDVNNFVINILLPQDTTITEQNMRVSILESSGLEKPEEVIILSLIRWKVL